MENYSEKLKNDIEILISSIKKVESSSIVLKLKNDSKQIFLEKNNPNRDFIALGSFWYQYYYSHFISYFNPNQLIDPFTFSEDLFKISEKYNPITINKNWRIEKILDKGNTLLLRKGFRSIFMDKGAVFAEKPFEVISEGSKINLLDNSGFQFETDKTWVHLFGKAVPSSSDDTIRYYFNINYHRNVYEILDFINEVIKDFNQGQVVFNLKVLAQLKDFVRADSLVIYIEKRSFLNSYFILNKIYDKYRSLFRDETPLFTLLLRKGWGFAEEPNIINNTSSFGQQKVRELAEIFINYIYENNKIPSVDDVLKKIEESISLNPIEKYYLNNKSRISIPTFVTTSVPVPPIKWHTRIDYLKQAIKIGNMLGSQAIWKEDYSKCLWIKGFQIKDDILRTTSTVCGEKMFGGTSGIAYFYSFLFKYTGNEYFRFLTKGAFNYAKALFEAGTEERGNMPFSKNIGSFYRIIDKINNNIGNELDVTTFKEDILTKQRERFIECVENGLNKNDLFFIYNIVKGGFVRNVENTPLLEKLVTILQKNDYSQTIQVIIILINLDALWINEKSKYLPIIKDSLKKFFEEKAYSVLDESSFFENFIDALFIHQKLKDYYGTEILEIYQWIDALKVQWVEVLNKDYKYTFHKGGVLQYLEVFKLISELFPKEINPDFVQKLYSEYSKTIIHQYLNSESLPPFDFEDIVYNPGLYDGVSGIGYFFLEIYDAKLPLLNRMLSVTV